MDTVSTILKDVKAKKQFYTIMSAGQCGIIELNGKQISIHRAIGCKCTKLKERQARCEINVIK